MNYSIQLGKHSADKDHRLMTWGTLCVDKIVQCESWVTFYTYSMTFYNWWNFDTEFHKWVHTAEHMIAYKKDTWSVRNSLEEVTGWKLSWKVILDISPYKTSDTTFGFRITSMVPLVVKQVRQLTKISIERAIKFLEAWEIENTEDYEWIPFARAISCWQYDFHNKDWAISDLKNIEIDTVEITENISKSEHKTAYVCDLRFLKPKVEWWDDMVMFTPEFSYRLSLLIEKELPNKLPWSIALVWTFGCMTGMYLCISSENWDTSDIPIIHRYIFEILTDNIDIKALSEEEKSQFKTLLENYETINNTFL